MEQFKDLIKKLKAEGYSCEELLAAVKEACEDGGDFAASADDNGGGTDPGGGGPH